MLVILALVGHVSPASAWNDVPVAEEVERLIRAGRADEAVAVVRRAYSDRPDDPAVRRAYIDVHLAVARRCMDEQRFDAADRAAAAVLDASPGERAASSMRDRIESARRELPRRLVDARRWLRLEMFEPAYETLTQAVALSPGRRAELADDLLAAAEGAGDDHFCCGNFREAFFYYDAWLRGGRTPSESLRARWMQSLVFALADEVDGVDHPIEYWHALVARAEPLAPRRRDPALAVLRGLANQDLRDPRRAAANYREAAGPGEVDRGDADSELASLRARALSAVSRGARPRLESRDRRWRAADGAKPSGVAASRAGSGAPTLHQSVVLVDGFEVRHESRDAAAAALVGEALTFHFDRVARYFGRDARQAPWPVACVVHLHADADAVRRAIGGGAATRGASVIRLRGVALDSHALHLSLDDPLLLSATIPHELSHLIAGALNRYRPTPAVLAEGLALSCEPRCRAVQFRRVLERSPPPVLDRLFAVADPHAADSAAFYAQSLLLTELLLSRTTPRELLAAAPGARPADVADLCGFAAAADLDAELRAAGCGDRASP